MRRQLVPGLVVRLTVIKAKTRPGIEARGNSVTMYSISIHSDVTNKKTAIQRAGK